MSILIPIAVTVALAVLFYRQHHNWDVQDRTSGFDDLALSLLIVALAAIWLVWALSNLGQ